MDIFDDEPSDRAVRALNRDAMREALDRDREFTATTLATNTTTTTMAAMDKLSSRSVDDGHGQQMFRRQEHHGGQETNVIVWVSVAIGFFTTFRPIDENGSGQFCSTSVQRHEYRRGYVAVTLSTIRRVSTVGRSEQHTNFPAVPEGFSDRLVRHADRRHKERPRLVTGRTSKRPSSTTSSWMRQSSLRCNVQTQKPEITSRICKNWRNAFFTWRTISCVGWSSEVQVRGSRPASSRRKVILNPSRTSSNAPRSPNRPVWAKTKVHPTLPRSTSWCKKSEQAERKSNNSPKIWRRCQSRRFNLARRQRNVASIEFRFKIESMRRKSDAS